MKGRFTFIIIVIFILGFIIMARLFELQVWGHNFLGTNIYQKNILEQIIPADRGEIFVFDEGELSPLAINYKTYNLIVSPNQISNSKMSLDQWWEKIVPYLDLEESQKILEQTWLIEENEETDELKNILTKLSDKQRFYEVLKKDISLSEAEEIKNLGLPGISFESITRRYYPEENLFSHVTGFFRSTADCQGIDCSFGEGQYGLEEFFNQELTGEPGLRKNQSGADFILTDNLIKEPEKGMDLILTLDRTVQFFAHQLLKEAVQEYKAESGEIIVMDPQTGEILTLCREPDFDPNKYSEIKDYAVFKNKAIDSVFEPGSIFKVITLAIGLDTKKISPETSYFDPGQITLSGETISNVEKRTFGRQTMTNVLEKSINTGAVFVAQKVGRDNFRNYLKKFGFGSLTQIEIPNEAIGDISNLNEKQEIYLATASFGQGITVTPIQMINAVGVIANQGRLMKPYLVKKSIQGGVEKEYQPQFIREVISPGSASLLSAMMVSVCENGYGGKAQVPGYYVAGKTGTAQVPKDKGGYSDKVIHSFIGFAPATNPRFVALVKLDNPQKYKYADSTAAPVFGQLAEFILDYYNVPPDKND